MRLDRDFSEFVALFTSNGVRFLIVGGYALAAHGVPRFTGDLDAWIWIDHANALKVLRSLEEFGFGGLGLTVSDFEAPDSVVQLGYPPHRIDILTSIDGVDFEAAWSRRLVVTIDETETAFIGKEDLVSNKRAAGRPQDIADVARLTSE